MHGPASRLPIREASGGTLPSHDQSIKMLLFHIHITVSGLINLLIQLMSVSVRTTISDAMRDGMPGELQPRTSPIIMNDKDAQAAAAI